MAKVAPVGEAPSADEEQEEELKGAALESAAVGDADGVAVVSGDRGSNQLSTAAGAPRVLSMHVTRAKEYEALLSKVTKSSKRAKLMSVQGVLFGFTFMMSTFETSNR